MNAVVHSQISTKRRGGKIEDYLHIHDFIDCTKELCSDNRHRILHTMWGVKRVIIPIFGHSLTNSDGKMINIKDMCEQDHILPDYQNRFIPNLNDFVKAINNNPFNDADLNKLDILYEEDIELRELMLSPLANTGTVKSLIITHNSWFINEIVPKILKRKPILKDFEFNPATIFDNMAFKLWMDNGNAIPDSALYTTGKIVG